MRAGLWVGVGLALAWAVLDPRFRNTEGAWIATVGPVLALSASLAVLAISWAGRWRESGRWIAVALIGQAATLQLIRAGPIVGYQHYLNPLTFLGGLRTLVLIWLGLQAVLVAGALRRHWPEMAAWRHQHLGGWPVLAGALLFVWSAAALQTSLLGYGGELFLASGLQLLHLGTIVLAAWAMPEITNDLPRAWPFDTGPAPPRHPWLRIDRFTLITAACTGALSLALAVLAYQRHPHVPDEVAYLIHASYFSKGMLWLEVPPVPAAFNVDLLYFGVEKVYSIFPPGWPAILAVGVLLGAPWIVNPVFAAINVVLCSVVLRELYDQRTSRLGIILLACSPWSIFMGMSYMAHTVTLTCALAAALGVMATRRSGRSAGAWLAGGMIGLLSFMRPLDALAVAGLLGLWALGLGGRRIPLRALAGMAGAALVVGLGNLRYNKLLTGDAGRFPVMEYFEATYGPKTNALGFGPERGVGWSGLDPLPGHGVLDVLINADLNLFATNVELLGWGTGSLLLILLTVFSKRMRRGDRLLLVSALTIIGIHSFYWFSGGPDFGARYWFLILVPCIGLTARGAILLADMIGTTAAFGRVGFGVLASCGIALVTFVPWRAIDKYYHYRGMRPDIRSLAHTTPFGRSLVLIQGKRHPDYHSAAAYNPVTWDADRPIYARDRNAESRAELLQHYDDRQVWVVAGPSATGGGYRILRGPLPAGVLR